jgi:2-keto-4-pentenoate hydratase/2-oxohepta-3-ene-1,7-dioic acid hydratase in catechol pathway
VYWGDRTGEKEKLKLCTFSVAGGGATVGLVQGDKVLAVDASNTRDLLERGLDSAELDGREFSLEEVRLQAPVAPRKFLHTGGNFGDHQSELEDAGWSHDPASWVAFFQNIDAVIGHGEPIVYPDHLTSELDYELELAVVVGRTGKWFGVEEAADYIGGYVIFNDITARDIQRREMKSGVCSTAKAIDTFSPVGPWITTPDEIPDPRDLEMRLSVNGELRQNGHTSAMTPTVAEVIAHYSPLGYSAGDLVSLGTVAGVAAFSEDPESWFLKPGDLIEATIEGLGTLSNPVVSWSEAHGDLSTDQLLRL